MAARAPAPRRPGRAESPRLARTSGTPAPESQVEAIRPAPKSGRPPASARSPDAALPEDDDGMSQAADWIDELIGSSGKAAAAIREFAAAFPPESRWGDPWTACLDAEDPPPPFAPRADSYATALREVMAGRRRVRIDGRWSVDRPGSIVAAARSGPSSDRPHWTLAEARGLD